MIAEQAIERLKDFRTREKRRALPDDFNVYVEHQYNIDALDTAIEALSKQCASSEQADHIADDGKMVDQFREVTKKADSEVYYSDEWWKNYIRSRMRQDDVPDTNVGDTISKQAAIDAVLSVIPYDEYRKERIEYWKERIEEAVGNLPSAQPERKTEFFVKLTVRNSNGRPYYSIIYLEDGNEFEGYSSYSLDVISGYLKRYFEFAQPERKTGHWIYNSPVTMKCDQCGYVIKDWEWVKANYCAGCGSPMMKEGER